MSWWIVVLIYLGGLAAIATEIFLPGMILGLCGAIACGAAIFMAYRYEHTLLGHILIGLSIISAPIFFLIWKSFVVRVMAITDSEAGYTAARPELAELIGAEGTALTPLRPSGTARIEGNRVDVVTRGIMVQKGTPVKVIDVTGNQVIVAPL